MAKRNPKQEGSNLWDCIPQTGPCPMQCNQCFYNRPEAFYVDINKPHIPDPEEVGDGIVRMNCGHDSNIQRALVIETAKKYKNYFFNTSLPVFNFPGPVVFTANPKEEEFPAIPGCPNWPKEQINFDNLMFVRLSVSPTNLNKIEGAVNNWVNMHRVPVVLTFMAYYDQEPPGTTSNGYALREGELVLNHGGKDFCILDFHSVAYQWKTRHINSYWCPTEAFMSYVTKKMKKIGGRLVTRCGTVGSNWCKDCRNCESYYWQTRKRLEEIE